MKLDKICLKKKFYEEKICEKQKSLYLIKTNDSNYLYNPWFKKCAGKIVLPIRKNMLLIQISKKKEKLQFWAKEYKIDINNLSVVKFKHIIEYKNVYEEVEE